MKKMPPLLLFTCLCVAGIRAQHKCDTLYNKGELYLYRNLQPELQIVATHVDDEQRQHSHALWQYYLSKPHPAVSTLRKYFNEAAHEFDVPVEILMAIGYVENNWTQMGPSIDQGWGIMHLVQNNYSNTLHEAAVLLQVEDNDLKEDARLNIRGAAALLKKYKGLRPAPRTEDWYPAIKKYAALINDELNGIQADRYFTVIADGVGSTTLWGETITLEKHKAIDFAYIQRKYKQLNGQPRNARSADYGPAVANLTTCNYTTGRTHSIDTWVNHWIGTGTAAGAVSWFHNCSADASAHFVTAQNGTIYQVVAVSNTAWHCGASGYPYNNSRSIGEEHEATTANPGLWNSTAMLQASAEMACYFCGVYSIPANQNHTSPGICGHQNMPGTNTDCPGTIPWTTWFGYFNSGNCNAQAPVQPANDYCGNATPLNVYGATCTAATGGDVTGATQSATATTCDGYASSSANDVWYSFVATAAMQTITVVPSPGLDAVVDLRTGCPGTTINCQDEGGGEGATEVLNATGLTPGSSYYVRVYDYSGAGNAPTTGTFTICITTPCTLPPAPVIAGTAAFCSGQSTVLTINNPCGGCTFAWSNGGIGTQTTITAAGTYYVTAINTCGTAVSSAFAVTVNVSPQPVIGNLSNAYCLASADVTLTGTPSGGNFSGAVSGNIFSPSGAGAGTHSITYTVTQNGCTGSVTQTTTVAANPVVQITAGGPLSFCMGGNVVLTATQGSAYSWSSGATTQAITVTQSGNYNVTVTNPGGCSAGVAGNGVSIIVYTNPVVSAGVDQTLLLVPGNSVAIGGAPTAGAGAAPYTYTWVPAQGLNSDSAANPLVSAINAATTYTVMVTDANGCTAADSVTVFVNNPCTFNVQPGYASFSSDGGIDSFFVDASAGNCTWSVTGCNWLNILSPLLPATGSVWVVYSVGVNNSSTQRICNVTAAGQNITLVQQGVVADPCNPPLAAPAITVNNCDLAAASINGVSYQWYKDAVLLPGAIMRFLNVTQAGYYYVVIADSSFCTAQSADSYVSFPACLPTGIAGTAPEFLFKCYPNPSAGNIMVQIRAGLIDARMNILNAQGKILMQLPLNNGLNEISTTTLPAGVYTLWLQAAGGESGIQKLVRY